MGKRGKDKPCLDVVHWEGMKKRNDEKGRRKKRKGKRNKRTFLKLRRGTNREEKREVKVTKKSQD